MKILCVFGQYQYGDPSRGLGTEFGAFLPALRRLGHDVAFFDSWDAGSYASLREMNAALIAEVERSRPDALLLVPYLYEIWIETIELIRSHGVTAICWTTDDSWKYRESSRLIGRHFDAITTTYEHVVPSYRRDGIPQVFLTQWAASAESLREPIAARDCVRDVSFVGGAYPDRIRRVAALRERGIEVECFGHGWPNGPLRGEEIPDIIRGSRVSLNFAGSVGENQIKARTFEVPGAGGFLLTDSARGIEQFYEPGKEIEIATGVDDLAAKIRRFVASPEERDRIARAGFFRTMHDHTYDRRLSDVLEFAAATPDRPGVAVMTEARAQWEQAARSHRVTPLQRVIRRVAIAGGSAIWGSTRGRSAARRAIFELSWRFCGERTYRGGGWPGRMFPRF